MARLPSLFERVGRWIGGIEQVEDVPAFAPVGGTHKVTVTGSAHDATGRLKKNDPETLRQLRHLRELVGSEVRQQLVQHDEVIEHVLPEQPL